MRDIMFVSIKRSDNCNVHSDLVMSVKSLRIEYNGTDYGIDYVVKDIDDAAKTLFELCDYHSNSSSIIFDCPVILKSENNPTERGFENLYVWQLKKKFFEIMALKGYEHTFKCAESIGESLKYVNKSLEHWDEIQ